MLKFKGLFRYIRYTYCTVLELNVLDDYVDVSTPFSDVDAGEESVTSFCQDTSQEGVTPGEQQ